MKGAWTSCAGTAVPMAWMWAVGRTILYLTLCGVVPVMDMRDALPVRAHILCYRQEVFGSFPPVIRLLDGTLNLRAATRH
jgi:hypothetical protein